jgi:rhodanese-related sulfurtransferase
MESEAMDAAIKSITLQSDPAGSRAPLVIDVRKSPAFHAAYDMIAGALRRDPAHVTSWAKNLPSASSVVVYCVHGHEVSQGVAAALKSDGISARYLADGIEEGWKQAGGGLMQKARNASTRWVTRERLALIVRGADTARLELAPQAAGLLAVSLGLSRNFPEDHEMLRHGMVIYDALYAWYCFRDEVQYENHRGNNRSNLTDRNCHGRNHQLR